MGRRLLQKNRFSKGSRPANKSSTDNELLEAIRNGNQSAFVVLYERYIFQANRIAANILHNADQEEEAVNTAVSSVWLAIYNGKGPTNDFKSYFLTSVRNACRHIIGNNIRARQRNLSLDKIFSDSASEKNILRYDDTYSFEASQMAPLEHQTKIKKVSFEENASEVCLEVLHLAYSKLPDSWQKVLWEVEVLGNKPREVAASDETTSGSKRILLKRARKGLMQNYFLVYSNSVEGRTCQDTAGLLITYIEGNSGPSQTNRVESHLKRCTTCTQIVSGGKNIFFVSEVRSALLPVAIFGSVVAPIILKHVNPLIHAIPEASFIGSNTDSEVSAIHTQSAGYPLVAKALAAVLLVAGVAFGIHFVSQSDSDSTQVTNSSLQEFAATTSSIEFAQGNNVPISDVVLQEVAEETSTTAIPSTTSFEPIPVETSIQTPLIPTTSISLKNSDPAVTFDRDGNFYLGQQTLFRINIINNGPDPLLPMNTEKMEFEFTLSSNVLVNKYSFGQWTCVSSIINTFHCETQNPLYVGLSEQMSLSLWLEPTNALGSAPITISATGMFPFSGNESSNDTLSQDFTIG